KAAGDRAWVAVLAPVVLFLVPLAFACAAAYAIGSAIHVIDDGVRFDLAEFAGLSVLVLGTIALAESQNASKRGVWPVIGLLLFGAGAAMVLAQHAQLVVLVAVGVLFAGALVQVGLDRAEAAMRTKRRFWQRRPGPRRAITWAVILL